MSASPRNAALASHRAAEHVAALNWEQVTRDLDAQGSATIEQLLPQTECEALVSLYSRDELFRSRVVMARHGFGRGEY